MAKQYVLLIQGNAKTLPSEEQWVHFFKLARQSGLFKGGSEIGDRESIGDITTAKSTDHIVGYMRFDAEDRQSILNLVATHPVVMNGGSVEFCEMPKQ